MRDRGVICFADWHPFLLVVCVAVQRAPCIIESLFATYFWVLVKS